MVDNNGKRLFNSRGVDGCGMKEDFGDEMCSAGPCTIRAVTT
jgi:hypothetical protein